MGAEDGVKYATESFKSLGAWGWLILFGGITIIVSIIYRPEYVPLGFYILIDGFAGYFLGMFMDRLSTLTWGERDANNKLKVNDKGQKNVEPPGWYSFLLIVYRAILIFGLVYICLSRYPEFYFSK